ncbi:MAG: cellulose synthase subunit BcsC-related outer membrane protein, partial [Nitrospinota bacterium]|nr:cellulose synthase subunit BcsC-related outer membrane protein [Nitrospinota bacterium]
GMADPYGTGSWGRVLKTGASAEFIFTFMGAHWFSIGGGYNQYSGRGVVDNTDFNATTSVGRAFSTESWDIAAGLFAYTARFDKNSNFFTWGHGGYFSPQEFMLGGVMLSMETKPVENFWAEVKLSASYMNFVNNESSKYPLSNESRLSSEVYPGDDISQMGYAMSGRMYKQFADHWLAGVGATFNKASDYTETIFMVTLRYQFGLRKAVLFVKE